MAVPLFLYGIGGGFAQEKSKNRLGLLGVGLCPARQYELFFYGNLRRTRIIFCDR